jgi:VWFA-related protein
MAMLSPKSAWSWALVFAIFSFISFAATGNASSATYHTGTSEVRISFFATDEHNRVVENVRKDDFAVVDSGMIIRDFRSLTRSDETALDIVVLFDASESVAPRFRSVTNDVLELVSQNPPPLRDRFTLITFAGLEPRVLCSGDCQTSASKQKLLAMHAGDATPLFDALLFASNFIASNFAVNSAAEVRPILILFSDGHDTASRASARDALDAVIASGATLYTIDPNEGNAALNAASMAQMAEATGGRSFPMNEGAAQVLETVRADQRASYIVTYQLPSRVAGFHSLRILPKHNLNLRFHCRRGYHYEEGR